MARRFSVIFCLLFGFALPALAQEAYPDGSRYPAMGQGDTTPGSPTLSQDLELTVAGGARLQPKFQGSDDYEVIFAPGIDLEYKHAAFLVVDRQSMMTPYEGLGYKFISLPEFSAGVNLTYDGGRDAKSYIRGFGDIDQTILGGVFAAWHPGMFYVRGQVAQDLLDEYNGYKGEFGLGIDGAINPSWRGMLDLHTAFAGDNYTDAYFGVTGAQSTNSGLPVYNPKGGFYKTGLAGTLQYQLTQGAFLQGIVSYDELTGDAADSPVSRDNSQWGLQGMVGYRF